MYQDGGAGLWYHEDGLGSVRALTNGSGAVAGDYAYSAFGLKQATGDTGVVGSGGKIANDHLYAGEQLDPTGLYFNRARYYSSSLGRFIGRDVFPGFPELPGSLNRYNYVLNNPTNLIDPSGYAPQLDDCDVGNCSLEVRQENLHIFVLYTGPDYASKNNTIRHIRFDGEDRGMGYNLIGEDKPQFFDLPIRPKFPPPSLSESLGNLLGFKAPLWKEQLNAEEQDYDVSFYHPKTEAEKNKEPSVNIWNAVGQACTDKLKCLRNAMKLINSWHIPYTNLIFGDYKNSNSVARTLLALCGISNPKTPDGSSGPPGWSRILNAGDKPNYLWDRLPSSDQRYPTDPITICRLFKICF